VRRAYDPSGLGRRGPRLRRHPQHQTGCVGGLRGQRQLAAGNKIELLRFAPHFQHDGAYCIADKRIGGRPQRVVHIGGADGDQKARIETEFGEPAHRQRARFKLREILSDPNHWPSRGHPPRQPSNKAGRRSALPSGFRKHLVHGAQSDPALQAGIGFRMPERHLLQIIRCAVRLDAFDAAA
jgi:hypothetical protein